MKHKLRENRFFLKLYVSSKDTIKKPGKPQVGGK